MQTAPSLYGYAAREERRDALSRHCRHQQGEGAAVVGERFVAHRLCGVAVAAHGLYVVRVVRRDVACAAQCRQLREEVAVGLPLVLQRRRTEYHECLVHNAVALHCVGIEGVGNAAEQFVGVYVVCQGHTVCVYCVPTFSIVGIFLQN